MTKPKRILITAIMALAIFGLLYAAADKNEALKIAALTVLSAVGYAALTVAFYWLLGDSKQAEPTPYVEPVKAYDYAADETTRDIGRTVDEIMAEVLVENGQEK
jgi:hypothetical protein